MLLIYSTTFGLQNHVFEGLAMTDHISLKKRQYSTGDCGRYTREVSPAIQIPDNSPILGVFKKIF